MKSVAFIRSNDWFSATMHGTHNGYVAIPPTNKFYNMTIEQLEDSLLVHGGITFFEPVIYREKSRCGFVTKPELIGRRNRILEKAEFITDDTEIGDDWKILGFDTFHYGDDEENWYKERVIFETLFLLDRWREVIYDTESRNVPSRVRRVREILYGRRRNHRMGITRIRKVHRSRVRMVCRQP